MSAPNENGQILACTPAYLTKRQLSERSGLSAATIQRYKDSQKIPFFQPSGRGGKLLFPRDAIELARAHSTATQQSTDAVACDPTAIHSPHATETQRGHKQRGPRPRWQTAHKGINTDAKKL
jgi:hypothetical protein